MAKGVQASLVRPHLLAIGPLDPLAHYHDAVLVGCDGLLDLGQEFFLLEDKLRLATTVSSSTGDLNRTLAQLGIDYSITLNHALALQYDYIQNSGYKDDNVMSLVYRFNF